MAVGDDTPMLDQDAIEEPEPMADAHTNTDIDNTSDAHQPPASSLSPKSALVRDMDVSPKSPLATLEPESAPSPTSSPHADVSPNAEEHHELNYEDIPSDRGESPLEPPEEEEDDTLSSLPQDQDPQNQNQKKSPNDVLCAITIHPELFTHTDTFPSSLALSVLRSSLAKSFRTSPTHVQVFVRGIEEDTSSWTLGQVVAALAVQGTLAGDVASGSPVQLDMYTEEQAIAEDTESAGPPVDVIRVTVADDADPDTRAIVFVRIVKEYVRRPKPFLGGWRNKRVGKEFHHASTQTAKKGKGQTSVPKHHRSTQTVGTSSRTQQTSKEIATQTITVIPGVGSVESTASDRRVAPRPYVTADEVLLQRQAHAVEIQCYLRACFARRRIRRLVAEQRAQADAEREEAEARMERQRVEVERETQRRLHPMTKQDFAVLADELAAWKAHQLSKIKASGASEQEQQFLTQQVLGKELAVTQITERLRQEALLKRREAATDARLAKLSSGHAWQAGGNTVIVDTPHTLRAKELVTVHKGLQADLSVAERLDVLGTAKVHVGEFKTALSKELLLLMEREEDLLRRGRGALSLAGLRKRISQGFLEFVNDQVSDKAE
jgi:hypothetical protein